MEIHRKGMEHLNPILRKQHAGRADQVKRQDVKPRSQAERVHISQQAKSLSKGKEVLRRTPDVRPEVVTALKAKIAAGEYRVDSRGLAEAILGGKIIDV